MKKVEVFGQVEEAEVDAGVFGMVSGGKFALGFGKVKWAAVGLGCSGNHVYDEGYDCGNVSGEYKPKVALFLDDAGDAHCPGEAHHGDDAQSDGKLVANHLCT